METKGPEIHPDQIEFDDMPESLSDLIEDRIDAMMWHSLGGDLSEDRERTGESFYEPLKRRHSETLESNSWLKEIYDLVLRAYEGAFPGVDLEILPQDTIFYIDDFERYSATIETKKLADTMGDYNYLFGLGYVNGEMVSDLHGQKPNIREALKGEASEEEIEDFIQERIKYYALLTILHEFIHATSHNIENDTEEKDSYVGLLRIPTARTVISPEATEDRFQGINEILTEYLTVKAVMLLGDKSDTLSQFAESDLARREILKIGKRIEEIIGELSLVEIYFSSDRERFDKLLNNGNENIGLKADESRSKVVVDSIGYSGSSPIIEKDDEIHRALGLNQ